MASMAREDRLQNLFNSAIALGEFSPL